MFAVFRILHDSWMAFFWRGQCQVSVWREKAAKFYSILVIGFVIVGSTLKVQLVWSLSDFFNGLMVIPNAIALWALSGVVVKICKQYGKK